MEMEGAWAEHMGEVVVEVDEIVGRSGPAEKK